MKGELRGRLARRRRASTRPSTEPRTRPASRASCSRRPTSSSAEPRRGRSSPASSRPSRTQIRGVDMGYARVEEPERLRRAEDRLDDRARGAGPRGARAGRGGDLQPAQRRDQPRHRRDDPLRGPELRRAAHRPSACSRTRPYNTRVNPGLPPTPIGNPGLASIEAAAKPAEGGLPLLRRQARDLRRALLHRQRGRVRPAAAEYQAALEAEGGSPTDC